MVKAAQATKATAHGGAVHGANPQGGKPQDKPASSAKATTSAGKTAAGNLPDVHALREDSSKTPTIRVSGHSRSGTF